MRPSQIARIALCVSLFTVTAAEWAWSAPTTAQRRDLLSIKVSVRKASRLLDAGKVADAATEVNAAQEQLTTLLAGADADMVKLIEPVMKDLKGVHALLEIEGLRLDPLPELKAGAAPAPEPGAPAPQPTPPAAMGISFSRQIAPLLISKCGKCHIDTAKGMVSMANFALLMRGSPKDGVIVQPGDGTGSRIIEVIESGDMPRGGGKLSKAEFDLLSKWIADGAKYDAPNPTIPLRQLASAASAVPPPMIAPATGKETVRFSLEIAPTLVAQCAGCHGEQRPRADFSIANFTRMMRGGDSGAVVAPGRPADSLLVQKLKGMAGARMPLDKPALSAAIIAKIEKWIEEGARFDGKDPNLAMARVVAIARTETSTPEELTAQRREQAERTWKLAIPDDQATYVETKNFLIVGNYGEGVLTEVGEAAEKQTPQVLNTLKASAKDGLVRGRLTIYVFANRFDYVEFGLMQEKRDLPKSWRGHGWYDVVEPYAAIVPPKDEEYSLNTLLAQTLGSIYVAERSGSAAPAWLVEGAGRAIAAKIDAKDERVQYWDSLLGDYVRRQQNPGDFLAGSVSSEQVGVLSYSFVDFLLSSTTRFAQLLSAMEAGASVEQAFGAAYGAAPPQLAVNWARRAGK
jgi:mono/diheme cytochrome c family protein